MKKWLISANGKMYDHASAFAKWGFIDWRQKCHYHVGDIVYIYCTKPYQKVMYKTLVEAESLSSSEIVNDKEFWYKTEEYEKGLEGKFARLRLIEQTNTNKLSLEELQNHGLNGRIQGPRRISEDLSKFIDRYMRDEYSNGIFPDSDLPDDFYEGATKKVLVNKYERSSIARQKCLEYHGCKCSICGLDFEEKYGEIGKGFIHVHHIVPLNKINSEYVVDYKKDLIPVCPNCHAMLHRKINGVEISPDELKIIVNIQKGIDS